MTENLKIYRLIPSAPLDDPQWMGGMSQGEITVRARTTGDARVVASEAELDFMEIDASPAEGNTTISASVFRNEKLYTVIEDISGRFSPQGPRQVVDGLVRIDTTVPLQVD